MGKLRAVTCLACLRPNVIAFRDSHEPPRGLPPRPVVSYSDRDSRGYDEPRGEERYRDREPRYHRDDYRGGDYRSGGGRNRSWDDEERYHKRGRYEVSC